MRALAPWALLLPLMLVLLPATVRAASVSVALTTPSTSITPDTDFEVSLTLTGAGAAINAFDAVIGYDPSALTLVALSPISLQDGTLMVAACSNRFRKFRAGVGSDSITLALLCNGASVTGPGQIYRLRFHASSTPSVTTIRFLPGLRFYNEGILITPTESTDLTVHIGTTTDVADGALPAARLSLLTAPNPSGSVARLLVESPQSGMGELVVADVSGRVVRRLFSGWFEAGRRELTWDGRNDSGLRVPAGQYFVRARVGQREGLATLVRLR